MTQARPDTTASARGRKNKILFENLTPLHPTSIKLERDVKAEENITAA